MVTNLVGIATRVEVGDVMATAKKAPVGELSGKSVYRQGRKRKAEIQELYRRHEKKPKNRPRGFDKPLGRSFYEIPKSCS